MLQDNLASRHAELTALSVTAYQEPYVLGLINIGMGTSMKCPLNRLNYHESYIVIYPQTDTESCTRRVFGI